MSWVEVGIERMDRECIAMGVSWEEVFWVNKHLTYVGGSLSIFLLFG